MRPDFLELPKLDWTEAGAPVSQTFGDVYFSREDGLAETRAVFLQGCGLPEAWHGRRRFVVGELGFGTGLNILALLDLWSRTRPPDGHLNIWSVEAHPLWRDAAASAHAAWPELSAISRLLLERWPVLTPGVHRIDLPEFHATLDLAFGDAETMLTGWTGRADAWFLDGFAPSTNPAMWSDSVLGLIAARSAPGARAATFTVAGQVRRGLTAGGFEIEKKPGHGRKRERLEAVLPGKPADRPEPERIAVIGAGIAGAAVVRAFARLGRRVTLIEAEAPGAGASGSPAALVTPWVDAGLSPAAVLAAQAFLRASGLYQTETPQAVIDRGVLRLARDPADQARLLKVAGQPIWPSILFSPLDAAGAAALIDEATGPEGFWLMDALVIEPRAALHAWLASASDRIKGRVAAIEPGFPAVVRFEDGRSLAFDAVVLAAGWGSASLLDLGLKPVRGQLAWADGVDPGRAAVWGPGYAVPTRSGVLCGATHDRGQDDAGVDPADTARLVDRLETVRPVLADRIRQRPLSARAAVRAVTPDHRPVCGEAGTGLFVLGGLGGRGFSWAPLLAEHLAAQVCVTPSPLSADLVSLISPSRLQVRAPESTGDRP